MESLQVSAKTVEEAIQRALEQLGVSREAVEVTVVREGKSGILGLGSEEALVRVTLRAPVPEGGVTETAKSVLEQLLVLMDVSGAVVAQASPVAESGGGAGAPLLFNISGEDLGILIGRRGQTLSCLQYVVRLIVGHRTDSWLPILIDVEGYRQRRYQALQTFAQHMAEQVKARGVPFTLEPMPSYERRIIHVALADHPDVTTQSVGEGEARKVVILPRKK